MTAESRDSRGHLRRRNRPRLDIGPLGAEEAERHCGRHRLTRRGDLATQLVTSGGGYRLLPAWPMTLVLAAKSSLPRARPRPMFRPACGRRQPSAPNGCGTSAPCRRAAEGRAPSRCQGTSDSGPGSGRPSIGADAQIAAVEVLGNRARHVEIDRGDLLPYGRVVAVQVGIDRLLGGGGGLDGVVHGSIVRRAPPSPRRLDG